jgi:hypothetical protein
VRWLAVALTACGSAAEPPPPTPPPAPPPPPPVVTPAQAAFARPLSPDIVGTLQPSAPTVGDYAMSLSMSFSTFVTTEMRIDDRLEAAMRLSLSGDGTAHACVGMHEHDVVEGQREYRPKHDNEHRESERTTLTGLSGLWTVVDGVATVRFDRVAWQTCSTAAEAAREAPITELRCIVAGGSKLPARSLVCELASPLDEIGMPMTPPTDTGRPVNKPAGHEVVLAPPPGVVVTVTQRGAPPEFSYAAGAHFDENAFKPKPKK